MTNVIKTIYYTKFNYILAHLNTNIRIFIDMKTLLSILMFLSFGLSLSAQQSQLYSIELDTITNGSFTSMCDSVIGPVNQSSTPIPSYGYLESNGYCYYLDQPQIAFTFCFEFSGLNFYYLYKPPVYREFIYAHPYITLRRTEFLSIFQKLEI